MPTTPIKLIEWARKDNRQFKWFTGAGGVIALAILIAGWKFELPAVALISGGLIVLAVFLVAFKWILGLRRSATNWLGLFQAWAISLIVPVLLWFAVSSAVINWPWSLHTMIERWLGTESVLPSKPVVKDDAKPGNRVIADAGWRIFPVKLDRGSGSTLEIGNGWTDIAQLDTEMWLCGASHSGGGEKQPLGEGVLFHSVNAGHSWREISSARFASGAGTVPWSQTWISAGPINALQIYRRHLPNGNVRQEGWAVTVTGIYFAEDAVDGEWKRVTPLPQRPAEERVSLEVLKSVSFAQFSDIADVEAFREIYAVGWQGIAHGYNWGKDWECEKLSYVYPITGISVYGNTERTGWAVGRAAGFGEVDTFGHNGSESYGAIYRLQWPGSTWARVDLPSIRFEEGQSLIDVRQIDRNTVIVVGQSGLIIKGTREQNGWAWHAVPSGTKEDLMSIAYDPAHSTVWVVGNNGTILLSRDLGTTWHDSLVKNADGSPAKITNHLRRIRIFGDQRWIVGAQIVLTSL